jgi:hypothetical protein
VSDLSDYQEIAAAFAITIAIIAIAAIAIVAITLAIIAAADFTLEKYHSNHSQQHYHHY